MCSYRKDGIWKLKPLLDNKRFRDFWHGFVARKNTWQLLVTRRRELSGIAQNLFTDKRFECDGCKWENAWIWLRCEALCSGKTVFSRMERFYGDFKKERLVTWQDVSWNERTFRIPHIKQTSFELSDGIRGHAKWKPLLWLVKRIIRCGIFKRPTMMFGIQR